MRKSVLHRRPVAFLRPRFWLVPTALIGIMVATASLSRAASSTFSTGLEGWGVVDLNYPTTGHNPTVVFTYTPTWVAAGGNPGGFIQQTDPTGNIFYFAAPAAFLGNQSTTFGQPLQFDMNEDLCCASNAAPIVILVGLTETLYSPPAVEPNVWTTYSVALLGSSFRVNSPSGPVATDSQLASVLSNLQALYLIGDWISGYDTASLDNVYFPFERTTPTAHTSWGQVKALYR